MPSRTLPLLLTALLTLTGTALTSTPSSSEAPPAPSAPSHSQTDRDPRSSPAYSWPLGPPHPVVRPFLAPTNPYGPGHRGVDLAGDPGEAVLAAADGVVAFAGVVAGTGVVSIDHADGLRTTYQPLVPTVARGQPVTRGSAIGQLVAGHCAEAAACLHWGVRRGTEYLDPLGLLSLGRVRLLPWNQP